MKHSIFIVTFALIAPSFIMAFSWVPQFRAIDLGTFVDARVEKKMYAYNPGALRIHGQTIVYACSSVHPLIDTQHLVPWHPSITPLAYDAVESWTSPPPETQSHYYSKQAKNINQKKWTHVPWVIPRDLAPQKPDLLQSPCTSALIFFKGWYYLYFESFTDPTHMIGIYIARSKTLDQSFEVLTNEGWQKSPTQAAWKPLILPAALRNDSDKKREKLMQTKRASDGMENLYWGAGIPRVTQKDDQIYLYFIDTSLGVYESCVSPSGCLDPKTKTPRQILAITKDPLNFDSQSFIELDRIINAKYFPKLKKFIHFQIGFPPDHGPIIFSKKSDDGIHFDLYKDEWLADSPFNLPAGSQAKMPDPVTTTGQDRVLALVTDEFAQGNYDSLRFVAMIWKPVLDEDYNPISLYGWFNHYAILQGVQLLPNKVNNSQIPK